MNKLIFKKIILTIEEAQTLSINPSRKKELKLISSYIQGNLKKDSTPRLNFICTHNSRRSQLAQVWAKTAAAYYRIPVDTYSGGIEVTACNIRIIDTLIEHGFSIHKFSEDENPKYELEFTASESPLLLFSKIYNQSPNPDKNFAAIMVCDHADENCPFIPGADQRIPLRFEDPKNFDETPIESTKYKERSLQIASEMLYIFSRISR